TPMEPKDTGQEMTMRQYLADLLEGGACLDRIMTQGLATGFPAMATAAAAATSTTSGHRFFGQESPSTGCGGSAIDTNSSRCTLFDQLLCGTCRKAERMLVPDLATEWFRKQKVFLDKLTPEELAELGDGLAGREACRCPRGAAAEVLLGQCPCKQCRCSLEPGQDYFRRRLLPVRGNCRPHCGCPASPEEVEAAKQAAAPAADPLVATCVPTLETRSRNPFLLCNPDVATCDADKRRLDGGVTRPPPPTASSTTPAACSSSPAPPPPGCSCMRGRSHASCGCLFQADGQPMASEKFDLRQSPQRRLDPALFRRISPEFFRILASYEATVTESCPLYGISMRHWSEGTVCCPCEQRPGGSGQQRALGDDAVATAVVTPCRPPLEAPENEEPVERKERKKCTAQMCPQLKGSSSCICPKSKEKKGKQGESTTHSSSRGVINRDKEREDSKDSAKKGSRQTGSSRNRGAASGSRQSSKDRRAGREGKPSSRQSSKDRRAASEGRQSSKDRKAGNERQPSKDRKAASEGKQSSKDRGATSQDREQDDRSRRSPSGPADFSRPGQKKILFTTVGGPMQCTACVHRPKGILGGFTGLCKRCAQPGRHLLYYLNHPPNQSRFGSQKCPDPSIPNQNSARPPRQPLFCTKPYAWSKNRSRQAAMEADFESERSVEGSSTTLMPSEPCREDSEPCVPCRTPASDRTLAGWNPAPSTHCSCPGRTITCRCPDEQTKIFHFPQTKRKPGKDYQKEFETLKDRATEPSSESECHRKISNEACYSRCGYLPKSAYLINDFHQLMRRVARPRPSSERLQRKAKKPPPEKPGFKAKPTVGRQNSKLQEVPPAPVKSLKVARATTLISQQKGPRPQSPKQDSIKIQGKPTTEDSRSQSTGYAEALSLSIQPADDLEEEICLCTNRDHDSLRSQAENPATQEPKEAPARESQNWTISCDDSTCTSPQCRNKNYDTEEYTASQYTEASRTTNYTEEGSSRVSYKDQDDTNAISWQDQQPIPSDKSSSFRDRPEEVQKDFQESYDTSEGFCSCNTSAGTGYTDMHPEEDESQDTKLKTGRRYYTETQGMAAKDLSKRCSCRSLHSKTSIRVLSSNTESVTCPCAPAPSVASVEKASDRDQEQEPRQRQNLKQEEYQERAKEELALQCQCGCCASRYDAGPLRAPPDQYPPYMPPSGSGYPAHDNVAQRPNRSAKSTVFGEYTRWERQPRNMSRPLLSTQRPSPRAFHEEMRLRRMEAATCLCSYMGNKPPGQDIRPHHQAPQQHFPQQRQWSPGPGAPGRNRQASGHLAPQWTGNSAPQIQPFRPHNGYPPPENVGQYFYGRATSPYQANLVGRPGKDRTGAMTAAAKGLRGLVKALGGPSRRSRNTSEGRDQRERPGLPKNPPPMRRPLQPVNYSQEVIDLASHPTEYDHHPSLRRMPSRRTFPWVRRPLTSDTDFHAPSTSQRARSLLRRERQTAGASPQIGPSSNTSISSTPTPTPLAVLLDALRAKHVAAEKSEKDLGSRLSRRRCLAEEEPIVIPATYSGLLEEQVLEEYLPSPRCKRRT
ncbi:hypothetical protein KR074_003263, partial [Drosophila pseudoananassae]